MDALSNQFLEDYSDRLSIIHYQSGNDRATNKFIDHNMIYVLGKFYIPTNAVGDFNELNDASLQVKDFTKSLILQATYRTQARINKSIKMFFSDDYSTQTINDILDEIYQLEILNNTDEYKKNIILDKLVYNNRTKKYHDFIKSNIDKIINGEELVVPEWERADNYKRGMNNYIWKNYYDLLEFKNTAVLAAKDTVNTFKITLK